MNLSKQMTRHEFLRTVIRSWPIRVAMLLLAGLVISFLAVSLWQVRELVFFVLVIVTLIILIHTLIYLIRNKSHRSRLDEESRLARSHWAYEYRSLFWIGLGMLLGELIAYWYNDHDPIGGGLTGMTLMLVGIIARVSWAKRRVQ